MSKIRKITFLFFLLAVVSNAQQKHQPNVVIVMADDLNSNELSCYGGENLKTTHIDALAEEGMKFGQMICSEAMCVPTRASLFTGLYPVRHGSFQNHKRVYDSLDIKSVPHYLGALGYRVALTGKDHSTRPRQVFPFDIVEGFEPNCVSPTDDYSLDQVREYITGSDQPFCLFVMSTNPHKPWTMGDPSEFDADKLKLPPNWVDTPETRTAFTKYLAEIRRLDNQVGDVVAMLKDTDLYDDTIVIFLGEQGGQFAGGKWTLWDMGQKSSMIVKWNKEVEKGSVTDAIVQYEDITPTLIDIAGGDPVKNLDGKSFLPVLKGQSDHLREYAFGVHNNIPEGPPYPIRSVRNERYKLVRNLLPEEDYYIKWFMNPERLDKVWASWVKKGETSAQAKQLHTRVTKRPAIEFYDLRNDPYELNNLAGDPAYKGKIADFDAALEQWMEAQGDRGASIDRKYNKRK
ncbi:sulfatase family protein [Sinomicrobium soli]|uniref:sulfatase family protein n=1 Tax=Sinomicrobium sp. N-1-3-6 TaxID=2219864 RepID=UPI000DCD3BA9|nr:sulfatase [Sinomicrobium sp. N-1-3-6]RAV27532.1 heparan N-sulfatase [Sinomicrobium sp. N-1-3-6]